jgi:hypothetical protein
MKLAAPENIWKSPRILPEKFDRKCPAGRRQKDGGILKKWNWD